MGKARDLARLSPNSSGQLPDANLLALAANKLSGVIPDANAPSGSVIQVVQVTNTGANSFQTTSTTPVATGFSITITPVSATSRIYVVFNICLWAGGGTYSAATIFRNGTNLTSKHFGFGVMGGTDYNQSTVVPFIDSPNTTSPVTYELAINRFSGISGTAYAFDNNIFNNNAIAMEIAG